MHALVYGFGQKESGTKMGSHGGFLQKGSGELPSQSSYENAPGLHPPKVALSPFKGLGGSINPFGELGQTRVFGCDQLRIVTDSGGGLFARLLQECLITR